MSLRIGLAQIFVEPGAVEQNLERAADAVARAAQGGARIVVLPECLDTGWGHPSTRLRAEPIPGGGAFNALASAARRARVYVCAGISERSADGFYNSAVLIGPDGELIARHRKLNELDIAHDVYGQGSSLGVTKTELGTMGVMICADATAQHNALTRALGYMGADVILSPSAWAVPPDHDNAKTPYGDTWRTAYGPVARDFRLFIVGVSNVGPVTAGPWAGWNCIGCSLVVGPDGQPLVEGPYSTNTESLLFADIELLPRPARGNGWYDLWGAEAKT
jgi:predicted amidohydrolase